MAAESPPPLPPPPGTAPSTASAFVLSLVFAIVIGVLQIFIFLILRTRIPTHYSPRTQKPSGFTKVRNVSMKSIRNQLYSLCSRFICPAGISVRVDRRPASHQRDGLHIIRRVRLGRIPSVPLVDVHLLCLRHRPRTWDASANL
jgi:hypothetical protein